MVETFLFRMLAATVIVYDGPVEQVIAVGAMGEFGVLAEHVNYITSIMPCVVTLRLGGGSASEYLVTGGLVEVKDRAMTLLPHEAMPLAPVHPAPAVPQ